MKTYISAQGRTATLYKLKSGKYSGRIADKFKKPTLAETTETRNDAGAIMNMHGEFWVEKNI